MIPLNDQEALECLRHAGWTTERSVGEQVDAWSYILDRPGGFEIFDAARRALSEFGGLRVAISGPGRDFARAGFNLDPSLALGEEERFAEYANQLETRLYPLGETHDGHAFLAVDMAGRTYLLFDSYILLADSPLEALKSLILGRKAHSPEAHLPIKSP